MDDSDDAVMITHEEFVPTSTAVDSDDECCIMDNVGESPIGPVPTQLWKRTDRPTYVSVDVDSPVVISDDEEPPGDEPDSTQGNGEETSNNRGVVHPPGKEGLESSPHKELGGSNLVISSVEGSGSIKISLADPANIKTEIKEEPLEYTVELAADAYDEPTVAEMEDQCNEAEPLTRQRETLKSSTLSETSNASSLPVPQSTQPGEGSGTGDEVGEEEEEEEEELPESDSDTNPYSEPPLLDDSFAERLLQEPDDYEIDVQPEGSSQDSSFEDKSKDSVGSDGTKVNKNPKSIRHVPALVRKWKDNGQISLEAELPINLLVPLYMSDRSKKTRINDDIARCSLAHCNCTKDPKITGQHYHCTLCHKYTTRTGNMMLRHRVMSHQIIPYGINVLQCCICKHIVIHISEFTRHLARHAKVAYIFSAPVQDYLEEELQLAKRYGIAIDFKVNRVEPPPELENEKSESQPSPVKEQGAMTRSGEVLVPTESKERAQAEAGGKPSDTSEPTPDVDGPRVDQCPESPHPPAANTEDKTDTQDSLHSDSPAQASIDFLCDPSVTDGQRHPLTADIVSVCQRVCNDMRKKAWGYHLKIDIGHDGIRSGIMKVPQNVLEKRGDTYKCPLCSRTSLVKFNIAAHVFHMHGIDAPAAMYGCSLCGLRTSYKNQFMVHCQKESHQKAVRIALRSQAPPVVKEGSSSNTPVSSADEEVDEEESAMNQQPARQESVVFLPLTTPMEEIRRTTAREKLLEQGLWRYYEVEIASTGIKKVTKVAAGLPSGQTQCRKCGYKAQNSYSLEVHLFRCHKEPLPVSSYRCSVCQTSACTWFAFEKHLSTGIHKVRFKQHSEQRSDSIVSEQGSSHSGSLGGQGSAATDYIESSYSSTEETPKIDPRPNLPANVPLETEGSPSRKTAHPSFRRGRHTKPGYIPLSYPVSEILKGLEDELKHSNLPPKSLYIVDITLHGVRKEVKEREPSCKDKIIFTCQLCQFKTTKSTDFKDHCESAEHTSDVRKAIATAKIAIETKPISPQQAGWLTRKRKMHQGAGLDVPDRVREQHQVGKQAVPRLKMMNNAGTKVGCIPLTTDLESVLPHGDKIPVLRITKFGVQREGGDVTRQVLICELCGEQQFREREALLKHCASNSHKEAVHAAVEASKELFTIQCKKSSTDDTDSEAASDISEPTFQTVTEPESAQESDTVEEVGRKRLQGMELINDHKQYPLLTSVKKRGLVAGIAEDMLPLDTDIMPLFHQYKKCISVKITTFGISLHPVAAKTHHLTCELCRLSCQDRDYFLAHSMSFQHEEAVLRAQKLSHRIYQRQLYVKKQKKYTLEFARSPHHLSLEGQTVFTSVDDQKNDTKSTTLGNVYPELVIKQGTATAKDCTPLNADLEDIESLLTEKQRVAPVLVFTKFGMKVDESNCILHRCELCLQSLPEQELLDHMKSTRHKRNVTEAIKFASEVHQCQQREKSQDLMVFQPGKRLRSHSSAPRYEELSEDDPLPYYQEPNTSKAKQGGNNKQGDQATEKSRYSNADLSNFPLLKKVQRKGMVAAVASGMESLVLSVSELLVKHNGDVSIQVTPYGSSIRRVTSEVARTFQCEICGRPSTTSIPQFLQHCSEQEHILKANAAIDDMLEVWKRQVAAKAKGRAIDYQPSPHDTEEKGKKKLRTQSKANEGPREEDMEVDLTNETGDEEDVYDEEDPEEREPSAMPAVLPVAQRKRRGYRRRQPSVSDDGKPTLPAPRPSRQAASSNLPSSVKRDLSPAESTGSSRSSACKTPTTSTTTSPSSSRNTRNKTKGSSPKLSVPRNAPQIVEITLENGKKSYILGGYLPLETNPYEANEKLRSQRPANEGMNVRYRIDVTSYGFVQHRFPAAEPVFDPMVPEARQGMIQCAHCDFVTITNQLWEHHMAEKHAALCKFVYYCKPCSFLCLRPTTFFRHTKLEDHTMNLQVAGQCAHKVYLQQRTQQVAPPPAVERRSTTTTSVADPAKNKEYQGSTASVLDQDLMQAPPPKRMKNSPRGEDGPAARKVPLHVADITESHPTRHKESPRYKRSQPTARKSTTLSPSSASRRKGEAREKNTKPEEPSLRGSEQREEEAKMESMRPQDKVVKCLDDVDSKDLLNHLLTKNAIYACKCGLIFSTVSTYYLHVGCHSEDEEMGCKYCSYVACDWMDFHSHFLRHG